MWKIYLNFKRIYLLNFFFKVQRIQSADLLQKESWRLFVLKQGMITCWKNHLILGIIWTLSQPPASASSFFLLDWFWQVFETLRLWAIRYLLGTSFLDRHHMNTFSHVITQCLLLHVFYPFHFMLLVFSKLLFQIL